MSENELRPLVDRVASLEDMLREQTGLIRQLLEEKAAKEWYSTAELAAILRRDEFTVREWCRKRRINAEKKNNGRGWRISHPERLRVEAHGLLPARKPG